MGYCIELKYKGKFFRKPIWKLNLATDRVTLIDDKGNVVIEFSRKNAEEKIILPSFIGGAENIGIKLDEQANFKLGGKGVHWFAPEKKSIQIIRDYVDQTTVKQGKQAIESLKINGYNKVYLGLSSFVLGIILCGVLIYLYKDVEGDIQGIPKYFGMSLVSYGLFDFFHGVKLIKKYKRIKQNRLMF